VGRGFGVRVRTRARGARNGEVPCRGNDLAPIWDANPLILGHLAPGIRRHDVAPRDG
jgi:hypothetical protein